MAEPLTLAHANGNPGAGQAKSTGIKKNLCRFTVNSCVATIVVF